MRFVFCVASVLFLSVCVPVSAQTFDVVEGFPTPASGAFGVVGTGLPDGRLLVWNGDTVFVQAAAGVDYFTPIASGYAGDPAFIDLAPDGETLLMGAGFSGKLYLLDWTSPVDYTEGSEVFTISHYDGAFLTNDLIVLDRFKDDFSTAELGILSLADDPPVYRPVMDKPAAADIPIDTGAASALLALNASRSTLYTMSYLYDLNTWAVVGNQLKALPVADLLDAFSAESTLPWATTGTAIGGPTDFNDSGPAAVTIDGNLVIGGFGSVQVVDPVAGSVESTYAPAGFTYYSAIYNGYSNDLVLIADGTAYAEQQQFASLPAAGTASFAVCMAVLLLAARASLKRARL